MAVPTEPAKLAEYCRKRSELQKARWANPEYRRMMIETRKGRVTSEETRRKMSEAHSGAKHHNFGKHLPEETRRKISESHRGIVTYIPTTETKEKCRVSKLGENNPNWIGDDVGYQGIHCWVNRHKPKPSICQCCGKEAERIGAANISGEYQRDVDDYIWLCPKCHAMLDRDIIRQKRNEKRMPQRMLGGVAV